LAAALLPHLVAKPHHAALVSLRLYEAQGDIFVEAFEERDSITDQDGRDRIAHFVGQAEAQTLPGYFTASDKPDAAEVWLQSLADQNLEIAGVELNSASGLRQLASGEDEGRLVAVHPTQALGLETQCGFIGS